MRVLILHDYGTLAGGAEIQMQVLRDALQARGHEVRLFTSDAQPGGRPISVEYTCKGTTSRFRTLLQTANPWAYQALRQVLATFRPDVVHCKIFLTQLSPLILPLLRSVPSLYHVVWYRPVCPLGTKMLPDGTPCRDPWGRACYRHGCLPLRDWGALMLQMRMWYHWREVFDVVVANSEATRQYLLAGGIEPDAVLWNGLRPGSVRTTLADRPLLAFAGRLVPEKGLDVLLRAFARMRPACPDAHLLVAGDGPERERLEHLVAELDLTAHVSMLGHLPWEEMDRRFAPAWIQVVPGRWAEPYGNTAAEAMLRGTTLVASNAGGPAEFVEHGTTGWLVPPGDVKALAHALQALLDDPVRIQRLGGRARAFALRHLSIDAYTDRMLALYTSIQSHA